MNRMKLLIALIIVLSALHLQAQELTTVILVRHAEKDMTASTPDPGLSPEGITRSDALKHALGEMDIDAVYSTPYKRTRATVESVALARNLSLQAYDPSDKEAFFAILGAHKGQTLLFSGHSNTVPAMLNWLTGDDSYTPFQEDGYDDLFIVILEGEKHRVLHLQYGAPDQR